MVLCSQVIPQNKWTGHFGGERDEPIGIWGTLLWAGKSNFASFWIVLAMSNLIRLFVDWALAQGKPNDNHLPSYFWVQTCFWLKVFENQKSRYWNDACHICKPAENELKESSNYWIVFRYVSTRVDFFGCLGRHTLHVGAFGCGNDLAIYFLEPAAMFQSD